MDKGTTQHIRLVHGTEDGDFTLAEVAIVGEPDPVKIRAAFAAVAGEVVRAGVQAASALARLRAVPEKSPHQPAAAPPDD